MKEVKERLKFTKLLEERDSELRGLKYAIQDLERIVSELKKKNSLLEEGLL